MSGPRRLPATSAAPSRPLLQTGLRVPYDHHTRCTRGVRWRIQALRAVKRCHGRSSAHSQIALEYIHCGEIPAASSPSNDPTVTRPILNLRLSPGTVIDADMDPSEVEQGGRADSCEKEELVLVHEVSAISSGIRRSASASSYSQDMYSR